MAKTISKSRDTDVQIISLMGSAYALVPLVDYEKLRADAGEDKALIAAGELGRGEPTYPADVAARLIAGEAPLKVIREWRNLTQSQLGGKSRVPSQYISQIERKARSMGRAVAKRLAEALDVEEAVLRD